MKMEKKTHNFCGLDFHRFGTFARIHVPDIIINDLWYAYNDYYKPNLGKLHVLEIKMNKK